MTALGGWFAARYTAFAQLNKTVLDASRQMVEDAQAVHARDGARILELETEILRMRGEVNAHIQRERSLEHMIERLSDTLEAELKKGRGE